MSISDADIKKLWGLAAGRCAYPKCNEECIRFLTSPDPTIIGEMAHVIAKSPMGPRGVPTGGDDTYENLILLCPNHHRLIDKAPNGEFPDILVKKWKDAHEARVKRMFLSNTYGDKRELCTAIKRLLIENHQIWSKYGPESDAAQKNPLSNLSEYWAFKKLDSVIPNNKKIINLIENHKSFFSLKEYEACYQFMDHANAFEANCYRRTETVPIFPKIFQEVIDQNVQL
jgi:hypothetical protein